MSPHRQPEPPSHLVRWLRQLRVDVSRLERLPADVSVRSYFRVHRGRASSLIAVLYPESLRPAFGAFVRASELLHAAGVRVPAIHETDPGERVMLIEDFGERALFDVPVASRESARLYRAAVEIGERIATLGPSAVAKLNPTLDTAHLLQELEQTWRLFLQPRLGEGAGAQRLWSALKELCEQIGYESPVPCHRDFMARNLMVLGERQIGVIDHQDLRLGPPLYDLASLLNDSVRLDESQRSRLERAVAKSQRIAFARSAAQRCLKIIGTFCAFAERGSDRYLSMIPVSVERAVGHLSLLPEGAEVAAELRGERWLHSAPQARSSDRQQG